MKKYILGLFVGFIGLINFGYCDNFYSFPNSSDGGVFFKYISNGSSTTVSDLEVVCVNLDNNCRSDCGTFTIDGVSHEIQGSWGGGYVYCGKGETYTISVNSNYYYYFLFNLDFFESVYPQFTSLQCQTEYNLIPISSIDQNYCVNNGLCPSSGGGDCPGSGDNWSALYINDIQHLGKPIINITFPDYLDWDYTTNENEFNLDIVGYPVDTEYIDGIIRTQNYKPTSEDFTQLVGMLAPYSKYLLFLLFIFIIWAWIKKPFKSKKL